MPLPVIEQLPQTSADAIRIFEERYLAVLSGAPAPTWLNEIHPAEDVGSPDVTFPISFLSTKYKETKDGNRFQTMLERSQRVQVSEFDAGYEEKLINLLTQVFAAKRWSEAPAALAAAEERFAAQRVAAMLVAGQSTLCYDGQNFFDTDHPANPVDPTIAGDWSNYESTPTDPIGGTASPSLAPLTEQITEMRGVLDPNGDKLGVEPDTLVLPTDQFQRTMNVLSGQQIVQGDNAGVSNPYLGKFKLVHGIDLPDTDWYLADSKLIKSQRYDPWVAARYRPGDTLGLRIFDEASDYFKNSGKIAISSHIWFGFILLFPHAIRKIEGVVNA